MSSGVALNDGVKQMRSPREIGGWHITWKLPGRSGIAHTRAGTVPDAVLTVTAAPSALSALMPPRVTATILPALTLWTMNPGESMWAQIITVSQSSCHFGDVALMA
jgi:hypothetical protein